MSEIKLTILDEELIEIAAFENLKGLCWNRRERYLSAEEAFRLYERNWRHLDRAALSGDEAALIDALSREFSGGRLLV